MDKHTQNAAHEINRRFCIRTQDNYDNADHIAEVIQQNVVDPIVKQCREEFILAIDRAMANMGTPDTERSILRNSVVTAAERLLRAE